MAQNFDADVRGREKVLCWTTEEGEDERVEIDRGSYTARKLVITAGPWAATLDDQLKENPIPERQVVIWTQPLRTEFQPTIFPVFNVEVAEGRFYGFPVYGVSGFKIGK